MAALHGRVLVAICERNQVGTKPGERQQQQQHLHTFNPSVPLDAPLTPFARGWHLDGIKLIAFVIIRNLEDASFLI